ncbi:disease resistance protein RUN1-like [Hevea brasiliensis]|nr:disease resistance protein RUN1-like [Hevea brasiliensis]
MKNLRMLILQNARFFCDIEYLSNELRYLEWHEYPFKSLPSTFQPNKLVELHLQHSNLKKLWKAIKPLQLLKIIDLSYSQCLIKTPDFRDVPNLEVLNLEGCKSLVKVHQSIGLLTRLVCLNMEGCENLVTLPSGNWNLKSLKILNLRGCSKLSKLPEGLVSMTSLEELDVAGVGSGQAKLAKAWDLLSNYLQPTKRNENLLALAIPNLQALRKLDMSYCNLSQVPNDLSCLRSLVQLNLSGNHLLSIPSSIIQLSNLIDVDFSNCTRLESLPSLPSNIQRLDMENCTALQTLPNIFEKHNIQKSFYIGFSNCSKLNYFQSKITVAFTWLRSYLLWLYEIRKLLKVRDSILSEEFREICYEEFIEICYQRCGSPYPRLPDFYIYVPGSVIPDWFSNQGVKSPLRMQLPPHENWWNIAGFAVCAIVGERRCREPICRIAVNGISEWQFTVPIPGDSKVALDHLSLFFIVSRKLDRHKELSPTELVLDFTEEEIKKCGIRVVYDEEIQELIQSNKPLESLSVLSEEG